MAKRVAAPASSLLVNSLDLKCAKASFAVNSASSSAPIDGEAKAVSLFFETLAVVGIPEKEAAYLMAMDQAQLSRIKAGRGRLPFDAIFRLPDYFWLEFRKRIDVAKGLSKERAKEVRVQRMAELFRLLHEEATGS